MNWHCLDTEKTYELTGSGPDGLLHSAAKDRLAEEGPNELEERKKKPAWLMFLSQFTDFMILVLLAASVVAGLAGDVTDTIIIVVIVILNAIVGFVQEYRAGKAMEALRKISALKAFVVREGQPLPVPASQLVTGDLVLLESGNIVPADIRLTEVFGLQVEEAALTGESVPVEKSIIPLTDTDLPVGDRINMAFKSTVVTHGRARGVVVATGMHTQIGMIARLLQQAEPHTPLQRRMSDFGKKLSYVILLICVVLFLTGLLRGEAPLNMLLVSISLAVAAIPEALPALITIALAQGARRLVRRKALVRKLTAVETLGSVTYICSDKTGTLTQNRMKVMKAEADPRSADLGAGLDLLMTLNQDVKETESGQRVGDPTELALVNHVLDRHGNGQFEQWQSTCARVAELPFDADRKCMTTVHRFGDRFLVVSKGATEAIAERVATAEGKEKWLAMSIQWAGEGLRVIGFAFRFLEAIPHPFVYEEVERELQWAGIVGMMDPPREEARLAIAECRNAGIQPVMITGDHPATAAAIAEQLGIMTGPGQLISGKELRLLSEEEFAERVERIRVYARVSPEQKLSIVRALQSRGHFVSMTGDGVNDAPSLQAADIGVAMGITGTDVSKEAAHMILLDDNFATIVRAVKEGRRIYDNIRKFVKYIMTCNGAEIWTLFLAPLLGLPIPLLPIHILWINLVTDGLPGLALAGEKAERDIMRRPPRRTNESLFAEGIAYHILWVGLLMAGITICTQAWALGTGHGHWQTMVFTVLSLSQLGHVLAIRSDREFLYRQGWRGNPMLFGAIGLTFLLQLLVIYLPAANLLFHTEPLSADELLFCLAASAIVFHAVEAEKWVKHRLRNRRAAG